MDINNVRSFWEKNPLWTGESSYEAGSIDFFEEHHDVYLSDCFAGSFDARFLPPPRKHGQRLKILDLGCGIGFWTVEFGMRGLNNIVGADLTSSALDITRERCRLYGIEAELLQENAEELTFSDHTFDHVNCQGVIHHTPDTIKAVSEIYRVLKPGGTACISVYYRNVLLRLWPYLRCLAYPLVKLGAGMRGRGREKIFLESNVDEIVRLYDGSENPVGKSYTRDQFHNILLSYFTIKEVYFHFFPARALPFPIPRRIHQWLDRNLPFMIYANVVKPCAE